MTVTNASISAILRFNLDLLCGAKYPPCPKSNIGIFHLAQAFQPPCRGHLAIILLLYGETFKLAGLSHFFPDFVHLKKQFLALTLDSASKKGS